MWPPRRSGPFGLSLLKPVLASANGQEPHFDGLGAKGRLVPERSRARKGRPEPPFPSVPKAGLLVVDRRRLAQDAEDLLLRGGLVGLLHRGELARQPAGRPLENLALRIALLGLVVFFFY